jgi:hypothetical protein
MVHKSIAELLKMLGLSAKKAWGGSLPVPELRKVNHH